jgi:hypothetical protein
MSAQESQTSGSSVPPDRFTNAPLATVQCQFEARVDGIISVNDDLGSAIEDIRHHTVPIRQARLYQRRLDPTTPNFALKVLSGDLHA